MSHICSMSFFRVILAGTIVIATRKQLPGFACAFVIMFVLPLPYLFISIFHFNFELHCKIWINNVQYCIYFCGVLINEF